MTDCFASFGGLVCFKVEEMTCHPIRMSHITYVMFLVVRTGIYKTLSVGHCFDVHFKFN